MVLEEKIGLKSEKSFEVGPSDLARALGSGDLEVLGTPALLAWMEDVCRTSVSPFLEEDSTSVGTKADFSHIKASPLGASIWVRSELVEVDRRRLVFRVEAYEGALSEDTCIARGLLERFVVDRERFLSKIR